MTNRADAAESSQTASVKAIFLLGGRLQRKALVRLGETFTRTYFDAGIGIGASEGHRTMRVYRLRRKRFDGLFFYFSLFAADT